MPVPDFDEDQRRAQSAFFTDTTKPACKHIGHKGFGLRFPADSPP
jgi:hypothetical protein